MNAETESFGEWLFAELDRRGWSFSDFARKADVSVQAVSGWVNGKRIPEPDYCIRIGKALKVDLDVVLDKAGHRPLAESDLLSRIPPQVRWYFQNFSKLSPDRQRLLMRQLESYYEEIGGDPPEDDEERGE